MSPSGAYSTEVRPSEDLVFIVEILCLQIFLSENTSACFR